ncbi:hypothetical protein ADMFC3_05790 [Geovibrio sp. ADMFC3]
MVKKIIAAVVVTAALAFAATAVLGIWIVKCEKFLETTEITLELDLPKNSNFNEFYERVFAHLNTPPYFREYLIRVKKADRRIKYGYYRAENTLLKDYLENILRGTQSTLKVTIPEGYNIHDIAAVLENTKIINAEEFLKTALDDSFIFSLTGVQAPTIEGFLYPDTYFFPPYTKADYIIRTMYMNFQRNLPEDFDARAEEKGLSFYDALILASIVQKETYIDEEAKTVASVFYNRLKKRMRLQADPTIIYGKYAEFDGNIRKEDIKDGENPYNTYVIRGLPPTPISNPDRQSLEAAAYPADTPFLYFVARQDGTHVFSKTYDEHRRQVYLHQIRRGK